MNDRQLQALDSAIRQLIVVISNNTAVSLAALPQYYTLDELCARYKMGRDAMRSVLVAQGMIVPERGKPIRVALEHVLQLDKTLKQRAA